MFATLRRLLVPVLAFGLGLLFAASAEAVVPKVAAGANHSLMIGANGTVWAWGRNQSGQLGDGTLIDRSSVQQVPGIAGIVAVAAGQSHSLALKANGWLLAWGGNANQQLGDGHTTDSSTPTVVASDAMAIAAGGTHSLMLKTDGTVWAWGANNFGQIGIGNRVQQPFPVQVVGLTGIVAIAAGAAHNLAVKNDGTVWAWGQNTYGQLGDGGVASGLLPVQVSGISGVVAVSGGAFHSVALKSDATVMAWGYNGYGALGNGSTASNATPVPVSNITGVVAIAAGDSHNLALLADGRTMAWGSNSFGELGDGTANQRNIPTAVMGLAGVFGVAAGSSHTLALGSDGSLYAWGANNTGQLGDGSLVDKREPTRAPGTSDFKSVAGGYEHSVALKRDGSVWAWGDNYYGQLGDGTTTARHSPGLVPGLRNVTAIATGQRGSLALKEDGTLWEWGANPTQVAGLAGVVAIAAGPYHNLVVKSDGTLWGWGDNYFSQLADSQYTAWATPIQINGLTNMVAASGGRVHSLGLKNDGTVWAWGGLGGAGPTLDPIKIANLAGIVAIAAGDNYSLALGDDGTVWAWGYNAHGQLGDGTTTSHGTPAAVFGLGNIVAIATGRDGQNLAVRTDGTVWAWGRNDFWQQWDGTRNDRLVPVQIAATGEAVQVAVGDRHDLMVIRGGGILSWGKNWGGELGDGTTIDRSNPLALDDRFPTTSALPAGWTPTADAGSSWISVTDIRQAGSHAIKSGPVTNSAVSGVRYTGNFRDGFITFQRKVSSKSGADRLRFYVDGVLKGEWSGEHDWYRAGAFVPAGRHEVAWKYEKLMAGGVGAGADSAWIDAVELPLAFNDALPGHWAYDHINAIRDAGITTGCGTQDSYCPGQTVTREQMAAFIVRAVEGEPVACTNAPFSDVPSTSAFCKYIQRLSTLGITTGCGGGNYCPGQAVTRDQMAAFIIRALEGEPPECTVAPYVDVQSNNGFCKYVQRMLDLHITTGCSDRRYCPAQAVSRDQMAAFLARAFLGM